jgi:predicted permease
METLIRDIRHGLRQMRRSRGITAVAVLCIALGVGANTAIFSLVNEMLLRPIPGVAAPDELVEVGRNQPPSTEMDTFSYPSFRALDDAADGIVDLAGWTFSSIALSGEGEPEVVLGMSVTADYFTVLGLDPARGRFFTAEETPIPGSPALAVISHGLWSRRFGGDSSIVGRSVRINGEPATVVGVAPPGFHGHLAVLHVDAWVPLGMSGAGLTSPDTLASWRSHMLLSIGRLDPGVSVAAARSALGSAYEQIVAEHMEIREESVGVEGLGTVPSALRGGITLFMTVLMMVAGLVLLIACVNVAGVLLVRSMGRREETAIRQALGAGRARLIRQHLTESVLLFALGGIAGVFLAAWLARLLAAFDPPTPPPFNLTFDLALDGQVLSFSLLVTLVTGLLFGLWPALRATRPDLVAALKDEVGGGTVRRSRARGLLVAGQVMLTLVLLLSAGLLLRSLQQAQAVDMGFDPDGVVALAINLDLHGYDDESGQQFYHALRERLVAIGDVEVAALARLMPLGIPARVGFGGVNVEGFDPPPQADSWDADLNVVSPGYFETMRIPIVRGRGFEPRDVGGSERVAIINETMAHKFWADQNPVGQQFIMGALDSGEVYEIVGVAGDSKYNTLSETTPLFTYLPLGQQYMAEMNLLVRGRGGALPELQTIRGVLAELNPDLPFLEAMALRRYVEITFLPQRVAGTVAAVVGLAGLLLAAVGIYGVAAFSVGQRVHEIAVRRALGAQRGDVLRMVVRQGLFAPLAGMILGLGLSLALARLLGAFLYGLSPLDPLTYTSVILILGVVVLLANLLPARRAVAISPTKALRYE